MPQPPIQMDPERPHPETDAAQQARETSAAVSDPDAPVSFVPHESDGHAVAAPVRIRTNRYGELEEHELIRLLDTIEDERARARFR